MKRLITLINQLASVSGMTVALQAQAENANKAVEKYIKDNEQLKQVFTLILFVILTITFAATSSNSSLDLTWYKLKIPAFC